MNKLKGQMTYLGDDEEAKANKEALAKKIESLSKGKTAEIAGKKVKISDTTLERAKKIKEIAKDNPIN